MTKHLVGPAVALAVALTAFTAAAEDCPPFPDVAWWKTVTHERISRYVEKKHGGDWDPYVKKWESQLKKLRQIHERGSAVVVTKDKIKLEGDRLREYIDLVEVRVDITRCLARQAVAEEKSDAGKDRS